jgi:hypothetical protein
MLQLKEHSKHTLPLGKSQMTQVISEMLALFRSDVPTYQPEHPAGLAEETGDPQVSLENLRKLGLVPQDFWIRKGRVLVQFNSGEQYLALGLSDPRALADLAAKAGMGEADDLFEMYRDLPPEYEGKLPATSNPEAYEAATLRDFERHKAKPQNRRYD